MFRDLELRKRLLQDAKLRLDFARHYLKELQAEIEAGKDIDGVLDMARRSEQHAHSEYVRLLREYSDLVDGPPSADGDPQ